MCSSGGSGHESGDARSGFHLRPFSGAVRGFPHCIHSHYYVPCVWIHRFWYSRLRSDGVSILLAHGGPALGGGTALSSYGAAFGAGGADGAPFQGIPVAPGTGAWVPLFSSGIDCSDFCYGHRDSWRIGRDPGRDGRADYE